MYQRRNREESQRGEPERRDDDDDDDEDEDDDDDDDDDYDHDDDDGQCTPRVIIRMGSARPVLWTLGFGFQVPVALSTPHEFKHQTGVVHRVVTDRTHAVLVVRAVARLVASLLISGR